MTPPAVAPRRWHAYIVDLEPRVGTKPGKQRPCLAIQPTEFGEAGLRSTRPFFDVKPESSLEAFVSEAPRHPVFRIVSDGVTGHGVEIACVTDA